MVLFYYLILIYREFSTLQTIKNEYQVIDSFLFPVEFFLNSALGDEWRKENTNIYLALLLALSYRLYYAVLYLWFYKMYISYKEENANLKNRSEQYEKVWDSRFHILKTITPKPDSNKSEQKNVIDTTDEIDQHKQSFEQYKDYLIEIEKLKSGEVPFQVIDLIISNFEVNPNAGQKELNDDINLIITEFVILALIYLPKRKEKNSKGKEIKNLIRKLRKQVISPFFKQDIHWLVEQTQLQSHDMLWRIYDSQIHRSTLQVYLENKEEVENSFKKQVLPDLGKIKDENRQPKMLSIAMKNGRIYVGWIISSARPDTDGAEFTLLPYLTKTRDDSGKISVVTDYRDLLFGSFREKLVQNLTIAIDVYIQEAESPQAKKRYQNHKEWILNSFKERIFCSNGHDYEFLELRRYRGEHIQQFYKSIRLEDVEIINTYNPSIDDEKFLPKNVHSKMQERSNYY